jgi:hypothetical protein
VLLKLIPLESLNVDGPNECVPALATMLPVIFKLDNVPTAVKLELTIDAGKTVPVINNASIDDAVFAWLAIVALDDIIALEEIVADAIDVGLLLIPFQSAEEEITADVEITALVENIADVEIVALAILLGLFEIPFQSADAVIFDEADIVAEAIVNGLFCTFDQSIEVVLEEIIDDAEIVALAISPPEIVTKALAAIIALLDIVAEAIVDGLLKTPDQSTDAA